MATKKNTKQATADKTNKRRQTKAAKTETVQPEAPAQAEHASAEVGEATASPMLEPSLTVTPMPAQEETTPPNRTPSEQTERAIKLSALDAAAKVLAESGQAMSCTELIAAMAAKGYWSSPQGRTPAGTLYSAVLRELKTKGDKARFRKTERGKFALRENV